MDPTQQGLQFGMLPAPAQPQQPTMPTIPQPQPQPQPQVRQAYITNMYTHAHSGYTHARIHMRMYAKSVESFIYTIHTHTFTHNHTNTHTYPHKYTYKYTRTRAQVHTNIYMRTPHAHTSSLTLNHCMQEYKLDIYMHKSKHFTYTPCRFNQPLGQCLATKRVRSVWGILSPSCGLFSSTFTSCNFH